jgi:hypothetical protein
VVRRMDNFNCARESFMKKEFICMQEVTALTRSKCYILPHCQGTDSRGEVKYLAKYSNASNSAACASRLYSF